MIVDNVVLAGERVILVPYKPEHVLVRIILGRLTQQSLIDSSLSF